MAELGGLPVAVGVIECAHKLGAALGGGPDYPSKLDGAGLDGMGRALECQGSGKNEGTGNACNRPPFGSSSACPEASLSEAAGRVP